MSEEEFEYDVAISYAGEDRWYVNSVAEVLRDSGVNVAYDQFQKVEQWGEDLVVFFDEIFRVKARYALVFISRHYVEKHWPKHEAKSAQARALIQDSPYLLPIRLDDSELPGMRPTVGYIDTRETGRAELISMVLEKLATLRPVERVPRTPQEKLLLLAGRPPGWEWLLFGASLLRSREELEPRWHDHQIGHSPSQRRTLDEVEAREFVPTAFREALGISENFNRILSEEAQTRAFGPPGTSGDPELIEHLARRLMDVYAELMEWAARLRGITVPDEYRRLYDLAAAFVNGPIQQIRDFVDKLVEEFDDIPRKIREEEPIDLVLTLTIESDEGTADEFNAELARLMP